MTDKVEVDQTLIDAYRSAKLDLAQCRDAVAALRIIIEHKLGDAEYATIGGEPVIRWMQVKTRRLDMDKLRGILDPAVLNECYVEGFERRFISLNSKAEVAP